MKPTEAPTKTETTQDAAAQPAAAPSADAKTLAPIAEPPKNLEFTEVPADDSLSSVAGTATKPVVEGKVQPMVSAPVPPQPKHAKTKAPASSNAPVLTIMLAFVIFVVLAAAALYAYTKSK